MDQVHALRDYLEVRYARLSRAGKVGVFVWAIANLVILGFLIIVGPERMFRVLAHWAETLRDAPLGWLILLGATVLVSIPPLMGYSTCVTLCGFAFGWFAGWLLASVGALAGAATAFILSRRMIQRFAPYLEHEPAFKGLGQAVRLKGLKLICLIRLCPFPFAYSNLLCASIETVSLPQFLLATCAITPKLLLHCWIGSRMFALADPETRQSMDQTTKTANILSIVFGLLLGTFTSWYVYRLVKQQSDQSVMLPGDIADESQLLARGEEDEDDEEDDVDAIERRLVAEGHLTRDQVDGDARQSTDRWDDQMSDFGDDEPRDLGKPSINVSEATPTAERPDPLNTKLK